MLSQPGKHPEELAITTATKSENDIHEVQVEYHALPSKQTLDVLLSKGSSNTCTSTKVFLSLQAKCRRWTREGSGRYEQYELHHFQV